MTEPPRPNSRVALVTGASRGLGMAFAEKLAASGYHVLAVARTQGALIELTGRIREQGGSASFAVCDIASGTDRQKMCRAIFENWKRLDMFVHAAIHAPPLSPVAHCEIRDFSKSMAVNCAATCELISFVAPLMKLAGTATAVFFEDDRAGGKFFGIYGSSKACQIALARSWQQEAGSTGCPRVCILQPRPMATGTRKRFFPGEDTSRLASPYSEADRLLSEIMPA